DYSASGVEHKGMITFFTPDDGACGMDDKDPNMGTIAISEKLFGDTSHPNTKYCGRKVSITSSHGKTVTALIRDACPSCDEGHLDLDLDTFKKLGCTEDEGEADVTWKLL
ncbi:RlpA-like double-psi beta-barrel-protein domain-containing protein-containing protein, partial [Piptocephalis cylindrospora]